MTTQEAFEALLSVRGNHARMGITTEQKRNMKRNFKIGKVSLDKMEATLRASGFEKVIVEHWAVDDSKLKYRK
jgi:hypothetical protein